MTQQKISSKLREARLEAGCAVIRTASGETLVAVVGGEKLKIDFPFLVMYAFTFRLQPSTIPSILYFFLCLNLSFCVSFVILGNYSFSFSGEY